MTSWGWEWGFGGYRGAQPHPGNTPELVQPRELSGHVGPAEQAYTEVPNCPAAPREGGAHPGSEVEHSWEEHSWGGRKEALLRSEPPGVSLAEGMSLGLFLCLAQQRERLPTPPRGGAFPGLPGLGSF